jgi:hypothetical protein
MATLFVRHKVADFSAWKKAYDDFDAVRRSMGVVAQRVYQLDGDPNDVTVYHDFATMEAAKAFAASDKLKQAMQRGGVQGSPEIWFTNPA